MDKKALHHTYTKARLIKPGYFLVVSTIFFTISIVSLRQNNFTMIRLRGAVITADQENGDVEKALQDLRRHMYSHMNTNLSSGKNAIKPPIQLKARYDRLTSAEHEKVKDQNTQVTLAAEKLCGTQYPGGSYNAPRVVCVQEYVRTHAVTVNSVPDDLYKFDFISPRWAPDRAGITLVLGALFLATFTVLFIFERRAKKRL